jgi:hypothetical protein
MIPLLYRLRKKPQAVCECCRGVEKHMEMFL